MSTLYRQILGSSGDGPKALRLDDEADAYICVTEENNGYAVWLNGAGRPQWEHLLEWTRDRDKAIRTAVILADHLPEKVLAGLHFRPKTLRVHGEFLPLSGDPTPMQDHLVLRAPLGDAPGWELAWADKSGQWHNAHGEPIEPPRLAWVLPAPETLLDPEQDL